MNNEHSANTLVAVFNWILGVIAPATWWFSANIDLINKYMEFGLKGVSMISFSLLIIINRKKAFKEIKNIFKDCPED